MVAEPSYGNAMMKNRLGGCFGLALAGLLLSAADVTASDRTPPEWPIGWSWLPPEPHDGMRLLACRYEGTRLTSAAEFDNGIHDSDGVRWSVDLKRDGAEVAATFRLEEGTVTSAGVAVAFDFPEWSAGNYVLAPAALYNGNRFRALNYRYPPYVYDKEYRQPDMPVTVTDVQRLSTDGRPAKVELLTGNCATPMLAFHDPVKRQGWILITTQGTRLGDSGLFVEEDPATGRAVFVISAPAVRERRYVMAGRAPSGDHAADWEAGDEVTLRFQVHEFTADDLPAFFRHVFELRKALSGPNEIRNLAPYSYIADLIVDHFDRRKWHEHPQYASYSNRPGAASQYTYQIGWSGPPVYSMPSAILSTPERIQRVGRTMDTMIQAQAPTGMFHGMYRMGEPIGDNFSQSGENPNIAMVRRTGEVLLFGLRQLMLLQRRGEPVKAEWEEAHRRAADALVELFGRYGQFGQFVDVLTGRMEIGGSTAGGVCVTGLVLAAEYFEEPRYLETAEKAGLLYYDRDVSRGYAGGGPAEILQAPDMEAAYNITEAFIALYEATGCPEWLARSEMAAHLFSTWMVSYDYAFPPESDLGRIGARSAGSIFASVQNQHSSPGLYISSGDFLLKLYRATRDQRIGEMYRDTAHNVIQYVNTPTNPINRGGVEGAVSERVNLNDWEGRGGIGMIHAGDSNMAWETLAALTALENPGIYLQTDSGTMLVLDHIEVKVIESDTEGVVIELHNPTPYPARVSVFGETSKAAQLPLGWNAFESWPSIAIGSGETVRCHVDHQGSLSPRSAAGIPQ